MKCVCNYNITGQAELILDGTPGKGLLNGVPGKLSVSGPAAHKTSTQDARTSYSITALGSGIACDRESCHSQLSPSGGGIHEKKTKNKKSESAEDQAGSP